jgi:hypothetical protein
MDLGGVTARDAGLSLVANLRSCRHERSEPVILSTGELVAALCSDCLVELPKSWGCADCAWVEIRRLCDVIPQVLLGEPCDKHR